MVRLPPPVWTLIFALAAAAISWAAGWPGVSWLRILPLGLALFALGWLPPLWAITLFRRAGTEIRPDSPANKSLVIAGPYHVTRNPMYLGLVVISLGIAFCIGAWPMLAVPALVFSVTNWVHIPFEEAKMRRQFGDAYDAYTKRVRPWL